jgi:uncharacterized protein (TIGR02270 family)
MSLAVLLDILEEHFEEADFLWHQRQNALADRDSTLRRLAELEERLLAHLDGLVLAEQAGWKLLEPKLTNGEVGEAFAAAWVALASGNPEHSKALAKAFAQAEGPVLDGIRHALRHREYLHLPQFLSPFLADERPAVRAAALDVLSFRRLPIAEQHLQSAFSDDHPVLQLSAAAAVGRLRLRSLRADLKAMLGSEHESVRREAMKAGLLIGSATALSHCRKVIQQEQEESGDALGLLALAGEPKDTGLLAEALVHPALTRQALSGLGWHGYPAAVDLILPFTNDDKTARLAGEAIARITGMDVNGHKLTEPPGASQPSPQDDDEALEDPDDGLPWPDPAKLRAWWDANRARFTKGTRYRNGVPYAPEVLYDRLQQGSLSERHHVALELAFLNPAWPVLETQSLAATQHAGMVAFR